jgi:hypothetical protein
MTMHHAIDSAAVRIRAAIHNAAANIDFEILSLPGGSLIAIVLWLFARGSEFLLLINSVGVH